VTHPTTELSPLKRAFLAIQTLQGRVAELERGVVEPIAIVGLSCRFPGAPNAATFWEVLRDGIDAVTETNPQRWADAGVSIHADDEAAAARWAGYLPSIDTFDPQFFGIAPREAAGMDPQQRLFLEVCWEALEDAGIAPDTLEGSATGVYAGVSTSDYPTMQVRGGDLSHLGMHYASGIAHSVVTGRVSYLLGLNGPSVSVDTACSSSLVAVHLACQSLRSGETDLAIAGGANTIVLPDNAIVFAKSGMLSPDGRCKSFDASANGFVRGEGCGVVVLKRLSKALADGDLIHAVIRGSAINQDGASSGLTAPSGPAQEEAIRAALRVANAEPRDVQWVETHGTGTPLGDPIEVQALGAALGVDRRPNDDVLITSVKSNIGHLEASAGIAGLIKIALALRNGAIPKSLHFTTPNPLIPWERLPVRVVTELTPWTAPDAAPRLAGVSSFGFSGTNAHVLLGEAPTSTAQNDTATDRARHVIAWSAPTESAMRALGGVYAHHIAQHPDQTLADIAHGVNVGRAQFRHRAALSFAASDDVVARLRAFADTGTATGIATGHMLGSEAPRVAFMFTGQGAQYVGMGRQLYETERVFRAAIDECDAIIGDRLRPRLLDVLFPLDGEASPIDDTAYTQPALFTFEYALATLWRSWGVAPAAVVGHSLGEIVAATIAGVLTLEDALHLVVERGRLGQHALARGAMGAVMAPAEQVREVLASLDGNISVAAYNGPANTVISGPRDAVAAAIDAFRARGINVKPLTSTSSFHSAAADAMLPEFREVAAKIAYGTQRISVYSNLYGRRAAAGEISNAEYWVRHVREPVQFEASFAAMLADGFTTFVEIGPHTTLLGLGRACAPERDCAWLPSLRRDHDESTILFGSAAQLYVRGVSIDWKAFDADHPRRPVRLPTYPFERRRYWATPGAAGALARRTGAIHPLLDRRLTSAFLSDRVFETELSLAATPWLAEHRVLDAAVLPATAYFEAAWAAAKHLHGDAVSALENFEIFDALVTPESGSTTMQLAIAEEESDRAALRLVSAAGGDEAARAGAEWQSHASATVVLNAPTTSTVGDALAAARARCTKSLPLDAVRERLLARSVVHGPSFQGLREAYAGAREAVGFIDLPDAVADDIATYYAYPPLLDAALQLLQAALSDDPVLGASNATYMPVSVDQFAIHQRLGRSLWSHVVVLPSTTTNTIVTDVRVFDNEGNVAVELSGLRLRRADASAWAKTGEVADPIGAMLYDVEWTPISDAPVLGPIVSAAGDTATERWIVFAGQGSVATELATELRAAGREVVVVAAGEAFEFANQAATLSPSDAPRYVELLDRVSSGGRETIAGVVHAWSFDARALDIIDELHAAEQTGCESLLYLAQAIATHPSTSSTSLVVVTRGAQPAHTGTVMSPLHASMWGLVNAMRLELPDVDGRCIDLDPSGEVSAKQLAARVVARGEAQTAVRGAQWSAARLVRHTRTATPLVSLDLVNATPGVLDGLQYTPAPERSLAATDVRIRVQASALNFRDVLMAMGMYPGVTAGEPLGGECAGRVVAVGADVTQFKVDDDVVAMAPGSLGSVIDAHVELTLTRPASVSVEDIVGMPAVFMTTWYSLYDLAQLKAGDRVLIHAGAGGVGLSAIQLAQRVGAEIFATAGSPAKRQYLASLGVQHVLDSRSTSYVGEIMRATNGRGVDVVLNSLTDAHVPSSISVLSPDGGVFIELGKRGIWTTEQFAEARPDAQYHIVDLGAICASQPRIGGDLLRRIRAALVAGEIQPLPRTTFTSDEIVSAFRFMAQAKHIGKIVIRRTDASDAIDASVVRTDGGYLVTGGLGGVGLTVAEHLLSRGAGQVVLMGRSELSASAQTRIDAWNAERRRVSFVRGDVGRAEDVRRAIETVAAAGVPLRGVMHAAGALHDGVLLGQTWPSFTEAFGAKVDGSWHLHRMTADASLDFFVFFSSIASVFGSPGQTNYSAANAYMDALAVYRRGRGLPALSINWGAWAQIGMAVDRGVLERLGAQGVSAFTPDEGIAILERLMRDGSVRSAAMAVDWPAFSREFVGWRLAGSFFQDLAAEGSARPPRRAATASTAARASNQQSASSGSGYTSIRDAAPAARWDVLLDRMRSLTARVLGLDASAPVDVHRPLQELGLDSLMAVELRNSMKKELGLERPVAATIVFDHPTVAALVDYVGGVVFGWPPRSGLSTNTPTLDVSADNGGDGLEGLDLLDQLENMSPAEIEQLLAKRMTAGD
jgi:acyl transferase domain-containing protein/acyl carrier protein